MRVGIEFESYTVEEAASSTYDCGEVRGVRVQLENDVVIQAGRSVMVSIQTRDGSATTSMHSAYLYALKLVINLI